jgi:hypothetical protein
MIFESISGVNYELILKTNRFTVWILNGFQVPFESADCNSSLLIALLLSLSTIEKNERNLFSSNIEYELIFIYNYINCLSNLRIY